MATKKSVSHGKTTNLESFGCIWLDQDVYVTQDNQETLQDLRSVINHLQTFDDVNQCEEHIRKTTKEKIVLIVSGRLGRKIIPSIDDLYQFSAGYIFCQDEKANREWSSKYPKVKGVFVSRSALVNAVAEDQKTRAKMEDGASISVINCNSQSLQARNAIFMWFQLFIEVLLRMHHKTADRKELIDLCKKNYQGNETEMTVINEFEKNYKPENALWWYTRESCFYRMMNKALRVQDYDTLLIFGFFITDIAKQIKHEHDRFIRKNLSREVIRVYRGQVIANDELELMKKSEGEYLSMNSFLSTTRQRTIALQFARNCPLSEGMCRVCFEIDIDPRLETKAFADAAKISYFEAGDEVLLMLGSLFSIKKVSENKQDRVWVVALSLASEDDFKLKETFTHMKERIGDDTNLDSVGKILLEMGEYEHAKKCYLRMVKESEMILSDAQSGLGWAYTSCKEYDKALKEHETALKIRRQIVGEQHQKVAESYRRIGVTHWHEDNYEQALKCFQKSLEIYEKTKDSDSFEFGKTCNCIAITYHQIGKHILALKYYEKALSVYQNVLPPDHPDIALVYNNLGCLYRDTKQYDKAMAYYKKSLHIYQKILPPSHPDLVRTENNITKLEDALKK